MAAISYGRFRTSGIQPWLGYSLDFLGRRGNFPISAGHEPRDIPIPRSFCRGYSFHGNSFCIRLEHKGREKTADLGPRNWAPLASPRNWASSSRGTLMGVSRLDSVVCKMLQMHYICQQYLSPRYDTRVLKWPGHGPPEWYECKATRETKQKATPQRKARQTKSQVETEDKEWGWLEARTNPTVGEEYNLSGCELIFRVRKLL